MKWFRAPELAVWAVVVALLCTVSVVALARAGADATTRSHREFLGGAVPGAANSAATAAARDLAALMPAGVTAGTGANLAGWADQVREVAEAGARVRAGEGAGEDDPMRVTFAQVAALAGTVAADSSPVAATSTRIQIGMLSDRLALLAAGQPVPTMPQWSAPGTGTAVPTPLPVTTPARPAVPARPATPLPPVPQPTLEVTP